MFHFIEKSLVSLLFIGIKFSGISVLAAFLISKVFF